MRTPPRVEFLKRDKWPLEGSGVGGGGDGWGREGGGTGEGVGRDLGARSWPRPWRPCPLASCSSR